MALDTKAVRGPSLSGRGVHTITTTEMHTGGEPVRIIESGFPQPQGDTILEKIDYLRKNLDHYRRFVILEPHGHFDMYAVLPVIPNHPQADMAAIFLHNEGYSTMCGHACIALGRYAVDRGLVDLHEDSREVQVNIQVPCGLVRTWVTVQSGDVISTGRVRFESVPSFVVCRDVPVDVEGYGLLHVDVAYGGAFYAFASAADLGLDLQSSPASEIVKAAMAVKAAVAKAVRLEHLETPAFLYGTMVVDSRDPTADKHFYTHTCVFADSETDRSACGSGCSARAALMYQQGRLRLGQSCSFKSGATGSEFRTKVLRMARVVKSAVAGEDGHDAGEQAVVVEVEGRAYYTGNSTLTLEENDVLGQGFVVH